LLRYVAGKADVRSIWLQQLIGRRGHDFAAVALASKNARIILALLSGDTGYVAPQAVV
jgi:transposase